ncbi:MAG: TRAM domain-containing protein [Candidatus Omnitrophica bacterium]|nr:TRAM domain-containing protein [Candidatus Omnitrophota bacterium]
MTIVFLRIFFIIIATIVGHYVGLLASNYAPGFGVFGTIAGFVGALVLVTMEVVMRKFSTRNLSAAVFGLVFGFFMAWLVTLVLKLIPMDDNIFASFQIVFILIFCYLGMTIAIRGKDEFNLIIPYVRFERQDKKDELIILDTSVIIDGRIADICATGFVEGRLVVPVFVLKELQGIADSDDALKRNRGRRGLDILNKIQKSHTVDVVINNEDFENIKEVDAKIVKLASLMSAKVLTNDFNLNKIAELQGVRVLNINELSTALRPVFLPGEEITIRITKEGKEHNQGIAYLDDGTMIVVDNARHLIGQTVSATVASVLQTSAGRMVFAGLSGARQGGSDGGNRRLR